jgi:hypothetical protein
MTRKINKIIAKRPGQQQNAPQGTGLLSQSAVYHAPVQAADLFNAPVPTAASSQTGFFPNYSSYIIQKMILIFNNHRFIEHQHKKIEVKKSELQIWSLRVELTFFDLTIIIHAKKYKFLLSMFFYM